MNLFGHRKKSEKKSEIIDDLLHAVERGDLAKVQRLVGRGANVNDICVSFSTLFLAHISLTYPPLLSPMLPSMPWLGLFPFGRCSVLDAPSPPFTFFSAHDSFSVSFVRDTWCAGRP